MNPERPSFDPQDADKFFTKSDSKNNNSESLINSRKKIVRRGELVFDEEIGEVVGSRNAWVKAGFPSIRDQIEKSDLEPAITITYEKNISRPEQSVSYNFSLGDQQSSKERTNTTKANWTFD